MFISSPVSVHAPFALLPRSAIASPLHHANVADKPTDVAARRPDRLTAPPRVPGRQAALGRHRQDQALEERWPSAGEGSADGATAGTGAASRLGSSPPGSGP